jgi:hypothetical protein
LHASNIKKEVRCSKEDQYDFFSAAYKVPIPLNEVVIFDTAISYEIRTPPISIMV